MVQRLETQIWKMKTESLGYVHPQTLQSMSTLADEHPNTLKSFDNLSGYYDNLGKIEKAIQLQEVCLEVLGIER